MPPSKLRGLNTQPSALDVFRDFRSLVDQKALGNYNGCEVYHLFFQDIADPTPTTYNLYTLVHFGIFDQKHLGKQPLFLNKKRIQVSTASRHLSVGILHYRRSLVAFARFYRNFLKTGIWDFSGSTLTHNAKTVISKQYVPANDTFPPKLNRLLKNNFFDGSYLIEHFDEEKNLQADIRSQPLILLQISEEIGKVIPIKIASVSDRLGGIVLQFPITSVRSVFSPSDDERTVYSKIKVPPGAPIREFTQIALNEGENGRYFRGVGIAANKAPAGSAHIGNGSGVYRDLLFDTCSGLLVGSFYGTYLRTIQTQMNMQHPEPRIIMTPTGPQRIQLIGLSTISIAGHAQKNDVQHWEQQRLFDEETRETEERRTFVQYGASNSRDSEKALNDLRELIRLHGQRGVWLWDPYLVGNDLIATLFRNPFMNTEMRALGSSRVAKNWSDIDQFRGIRRTYKRIARRIDMVLSSDKSLGNKRLAGWAGDQQRRLGAGGTQATLGLNLEFRIQHGSFGWPFHDRFLIFPNKGDRPHVWSLGTSVNSMGKRHHILQEVSHPARIVTVFEELWAKVGDPSCLIWKTP